MHQVLFIHPAPVDGRLGHPHPLIIGTQVAVVVLLQGSFEHPQSCRLPSSAEWPQVGLRGRIEDRGGGSGAGHWELSVQALLSVIMGSEVTCF